MKLPIRILLGDIPNVGGDETWGDVIDNWEAYAVEWNATSSLGVDVAQAPVLDMFGDESISIKTMVKDLSDPKKLFTAFSRSFTVPASKKNNRIFRHYYNIDITNGLDSRELIPAKILMNNTTYKVGNISIESVRMNAGVAVHYKIKFVGKLSELARKIGQDKLTDLDWSDYNIADYDAFDEFDKGSSYGASTTWDLLFPLASRSNRFLYDETTSSLGIEGARNIAFVNSTPQDDYGIRAQDVIGALRVGRILDQIETTYGFTFTGAFTNDYIQELYLWLQKPDKERTGDEGTQLATNLQWQSGDSDTTLVSRINGEGKFENRTDSIYSRIHSNKSHEFYIRVKGTFTGDCTIRLLEDGNQVAETSSSTTPSEWIFVDRRTSHIWTVEVVTSGSLTVDLVVEFTKYDKVLSGSPALAYSFSNVEESFVFGNADNYKITDNMPDLKVIDFLSILFKSFNVIAEVDDSLNISTTHYDTFMAQGTVKDISKYVSTANYNITRPNIFGSMRLRWSEPKVAMELGYQKVNGREYGSIAYELQGETGARLTGNEYDLKIKSQRVPLEPLTDTSTGDLTDVIYTQFGDLKNSEQSVDPMFTYLTQQFPTFGRQTAVCFTTGAVVTQINQYWQPSNIYTADSRKPTRNNSLLGLYFGEEMNEYEPTTPVSGLGLFNAFYRGTVAMMFDEDKRGVKHTAHLPLNVVMDLQINDVLLINNQYHSINSIETNYLTGESKLDLTIVGRERLPFHEIYSRTITNDNTSLDLHIVFMNGSGSLESWTIGSGGSLTYYMTGEIMSFSHIDYTIVRT